MLLYDKMKYLVTITAILLISVVSTKAQFEIDNDLILNGTLESDRQVVGLGQSVDETALLNASGLQMNAISYSTAVGTNNLEILLDPGPGNVVPGTAFSIFISNNNSGPVDLTVNGIGPYAIKKNIDQDLTASDLLSGQIVRVIFDGAAFQLLSARNVGKRDCPTGFVAVNNQYCIEQNEHDTTTWFGAAQACGDLGGRLCSWGEWNWACRDSSVQMNDRTGNWEWVGSTANGDNLARVIGQTTCTQSATTPAQPGPARNFRCCFTR